MIATPVAGRGADSIADVQEPGGVLGGFGATELDLRAARSLRLRVHGIDDQVLGVEV